MVSHLVLEKILPNLSATKIDELRAVNSFLRDYIGTIREKLPKMPIDVLRIPFHAGKTPETMFSQLCISDSKKTVKGDNIMKYLSNLDVKELECGTEAVTKLLSARFLKNLERIEICSIGNKEDFDKLMEKTNFKSVEISRSNKVVVSGDEILDKMLSVERFALDCQAEYSTSFIEKLVEKSNNGPGLVKLTLKNRRTNPFPAHQIVYLIEKSKFGWKWNSLGGYSIVIEIGCVAGTAGELAEKMKAMERRNIRIQVFCSSNKPYRVHIGNIVLVLNFHRFTM